MCSRIVKVTKKIVKKGISVGICLAMVLPILPLNFSFKAAAESDKCTSQADASYWARSDARAWFNNGLATSVPNSGTEAPTDKNFKLDSKGDKQQHKWLCKELFGWRV